MTNKEMKKLSRSELLEMLISQSKEVSALKEQLDTAAKSLNDRKITLENAGSIAEASLQLNGVFEAAQNAAEQYLENIQRQADICAEAEKQSNERAEKMLSDAEKKCAGMEAETQKKCSGMEAEMQKKCAGMEAETKEKCDKMIKDAENRSREYWDETSKKISQLLETEAGLKELLNSPDAGRKQENI